MSYCRFSDGDIYLFHHTGGYIICQMCSLAPKVNSIFTKGCNISSVFQCEPCKYCHGEGCKHCMINGDTKLTSYQEAIEHVKSHIENGDSIPDWVIPSLEKDLEVGRYIDENYNYGKE